MGPLTIILLAAAYAPTASAKSPEEEARELFKEGMALYSSGDYERALEKLRQAQTLFPSYKIDLNIGSTLNALKRYPEAAEYYDRFLGRAEKIAPREIVAAARAALEELKKRLASVELVCPVKGAEVEVDGRSVGFTPLGRRIYVETGTHRFTVSKANYSPYRMTLLLGPGEQRYIAVPWPVGGAVPPTTAPAEDRPAEPRARSWKWSAGWTAVAVGAGSLVTGFALGAVARSKSDDYKTALQQGQTWEDLDAIDRSGKSYNAGAIATFVIGGVLAVAGGALLIWEGRSGREAESRNVALWPMIGGGTAGLAASTRF